MKARGQFFAATFATLVLILAAPASGQSFGSFVGAFAGVFTGQGWQFKLSDDLTYVDSQSKKWLAPKGSVVDGASIPRIFWTAVGGPFEGDYRNASAVHDVACVKRNERWQDVHRMFYYAMRAGGVTDLRAAVMYSAVYRFGPRWDEPKGFWARVAGGFKAAAGIFVPSSEAPPPPPPPPPPPITEEDVKALETMIEANRPTTPEEVERLLIR